MNGLHTWETLNIFLLGSYNVLISMDLLEAHQAKTNYYNKNLERVDNNGHRRTLREISKNVVVIHYQ